MASSSPQQFYPSRSNPLLIGLLHWIAPLLSRTHFRFGAFIDAASRDRLALLRNQRLVLLPNHICFDDPPVVYTVTGQVGLRFHYLAALEQLASPLGFWLQRLGVYSIHRGFADRASIGYTLNLLADPDCKLVIFAEGGCSFQNDTILPFRPGAIQMAFQALNRFHKHKEPIPDLLVAPMAIKYRYTQDMTRVIVQSLEHLEPRLGITPSGELCDRVQTLIRQRLGFWEAQFGLPSPSDWSWDQRWQALKEGILAKGETQLGFKQANHDSLRDRAYRILEALQNFDGSQPTALETQTVDYKVLHHGTKQVLNYVAFYDQYLVEKPTQERCLDVLIRIERDVFQIDQPAPKGFRHAYAWVGEAINLKDWFPQYLCDRTAVIDHLTQHLQSQVQEQMNYLSQGDMLLGDHRASQSP